MCYNSLCLRFARRVRALNKYYFLRMRKMKKKIVSFVLALVMVILALVGCGAPQLDEINFSDYATFNLAEFKAALGKLEIEDGDFTNDEAYRQVLVSENVYDAVRKAIVNKNEKKYAGKLDEFDALYYCYYISANIQVAGKDTKDDTSDDVYQEMIFDYDMMSELNSSKKSNHQIANLGSISERDDDYEYMKALKDALLAAMADKSVEDFVYETSRPTAALKPTADKPINVVISFAREYKVGEDTIRESAGYTELTLALDSTDPLVKALLAEGSVVKVGSDATVLVPKKDEDGNIVMDNNGTPDDESDDFAKTESSAKFEVVDGDKTYTYSAVKVQWVIDKKPSEGIVFDYTLDDEKDKKEYPFGIYKTDSSASAQENLKGMTVKYHVFPVYYYDVPNLADESVTARSLLELVLGTSLAADSYDVFESEEFINKYGEGKDDDKTVKALVAQLVETYKLYKDSKGKEQHKWGDASKELLEIASVQILKKLAARDFVLKENTEKPELSESAIFGQTVVELFGDLLLLDNIRLQADKSYESLTQEKKDEIDAKVDEAIAFLKAIYDNSEKSDKIYGDYLTIKYDTVKAYFELKEKVEVTIPAEIKELEDKIKALKEELDTLTNKGDSATDDDKTRIEEIKKELNGVKADKENNIDAVEGLNDKLDSKKLTLAKEKTALASELLKFAGEYTVDAIKTTLADKVVDDLIDDILACEKTTGEGADAVVETLVSALVAEHRKNVYESMDNVYKNDIYEKVVKAVWKLIQDSVKVVDYPKDILKEYYDHIYDEYEYKFYSGFDDIERTKTNTHYKDFGGDFEKYLKSALKANDYKKAIEEEAKGYLKDLIIIYTVSDALAKDGAQQKLAGFVENDIKSGAFDYEMYYKYDEKKNADENKANKDEAIEYSKEMKEALRNNAKYFYVDNEAYNELYKKNQGSAYDDIVASHGERNIRACLQFNNLLDYLTSYALDVDKDEQTVEIASEEVSDTITDDEGNETTVEYWEVKFHNSLIKYTIKAD